MAYFKHIHLTKKDRYNIAINYTYKKNRLKISMLYVVGVTSFNTSFIIAIILFQEKTQPFLYWMLMQLVLLYRELRSFNITIDNDLVLINLIEDILHTSKIFLYIWYIQMNILTNCKNYFLFKEDNGYSNFLINLIVVINSSMEEVLINNRWTFEPSILVLLQKKLFHIFKKDRFLQKMVCQILEK